VLAKGAGFAAVIVLARLLAPADFGSYTLALSVVALVAVAIELGTSGYLVREGAQRPQDLGKILGHVLVVRGSLGVAAIALAWPLARSLGADGPTTRLIVLFSAATTLRLIGGAMLSALQALERLDEVARLQAASALLQGAGLAVGAALGRGLGPLGWAMLISAVPVPLWAYARLRRHWGGRVRFTASGMPGTLRTALAFGLSAGLGTTLTYLDSVMIHAMRGPVDTAMYGAAYRVLIALGIIPIIYADALTRAISSLAARDRVAMASVYRRAVGHLVALAVPVAVGGGLLAEPLLRAAFGEAYAGAAPALTVLLASVVLAFPGWVAVTTAYAVGRERRVALILAIAVAGNAIANVFMIPRFGIAGAAGATFAAEAVILVLVLRLLAREGVSTGFGAVLARPAMAAAAMAAAVLPLRHAPLFVPLAVGAAVYVAGLWALRVFDRQDREVLAGFLRAGWAR
jgi:O-antigen/teichoic acid export membrane protein